MIDRWEYLVLFASPTVNTKDFLDSYGAEGWELVQISPVNGVIFKRRLTPHDEKV